MMEKAAYDNAYCYSLLPVLLVFSLVLYLTSAHRRVGRKLPPIVPGALPILGHIRLMRSPSHQTLMGLAQQHGPIFTLRLGTKLAVVVTSASLVEECFTKNDVVLANRPAFIMGKHMEYDNTSITQISYCDHWRHLRRISAVEILSNQRINGFQPIRLQEVHRLVANLSGGEAGGRRRVEMKSALNQLAFDVMTRVVSGKRYYGGGGGGDDMEATRFTEIMKKVAEYGGATSPVDFVPLLRWLDRGRYEKEAMELAGKTDRFFQGLIDEQRRGKETTNSAIERLLKLQESDPENYSDQIIKNLVLVTMEWAMSCLLNNPDKLAKAREEIDKQVGQERLLEESDIAGLPYLGNIISETFRLYPASPLLVPHFASEDCVVGGYLVPAHTMVLVNAYAIHRDPNLWDDPMSFKPERHSAAAGKVDGAKILTFGMGRRVCPGVGMANRLVAYTLGTLIQCFEWERVGEEEIDMTEGKGITMPKVKPLEAICVARPVVKNIIVS
ncbi:unnamed protein product [Linum tenue]|uniref:Cytochrome P450 n=1 Tax=Linum tenue TaxID=586396 RepID=A0AAV0L5J0_9ROSI|nr:unnamed protein product [Linum tenue]